jgi:TANFOR domain-containing protein
MLTRSKMIMKRVFTAIILLLTLSASSQNYNVQISVVVAPPYSTKLSDYTSNPGKIMATVRNLSPTGRSVQIYLTGAIIGESGISVHSEPGYKPLQPLTIAPGASVMLNINNIGDIFDDDHLVYEGISENEIITGNGLPEDYYTICLRAWDWITNEPLSDEDPSGCCSPFHVTDIEPPMITQPFCGDNINPVNPQNVIISWTYPAGAPINTRYRLTMVEVLPSDHSPNDAMNSARRPYFFQTPDIITGTSYIYGPAQPALVNGKTYAFRVTAVDPSGKVRFRNNGNSEVCSFTWKRETLSNEGGIGRTKPDNFNWGNANIELPPMKLPTTVKGKLNYEYLAPDDGKKYPLGGAHIKLVIGHVLGENNDLKTCKNISFRCYPDERGTPDPEYGNILASATTNPDGTFSFNFIDNTEYKQLLVKKPEFGNAVYRVALICIETPHKTYYFNPEEYIIPEAGKINDIGSITAPVRSYGIDVKAIPRKVGWEDHDNSVKVPVLGGVNVYLCRKIDFSYQLFPMEDGKYGKDKVDEAIKGKFSKLGLKVLAWGQTNADGNISFGKLVWHHNPEFNYYLVAECDPKLDLNFKQGGPQMILIPNEIDVSFNGSHTTNTTTLNPSTINYNSLVFNSHKESINLPMNPQLPRVAGTVKSNENTDVISGVKVELKEVYSFTKEQDVWAIYPNNKRDNELISCIDNDCGHYEHTETFITDSSGEFEFKDLTMLYTGRDKTVVGPDREVKASLKGYTSDTRDCNILFYGEQRVLNGMTISKGASLKGRVLDGDNGNAVVAHMRQPGGKGYSSKFPWGYYELPVLLLPNEQQKLIVEAEGYITDTILFTANKNINSLDIQLFKVKRRLKIYVHEKDNLYKAIKLAHVQILNVTDKSNNTLVPMGYYTFEDGIAEFSFENAGNDPNISYRVKVSMMTNSQVNYEAKFYNIKIPVSKDPVYIRCGLAPAACLKGYVYAGEGTESAVGIAKVSSRYVINRGLADTIYDLSDPSGYYTLHNVPVRNYQQTFTASKSGQFIGDEQKISVTKASDVCIPKDFHLTVYNDMDITKLMGFPMEVLKLKEEKDGTIWINGNLIELPSNDQFALNQSAVIPFSNVKIKKGSLKNSQGIPIAEPVTVPVKTSINSFGNVVLMNSFMAKMVSTDGIQLDRQQGSAYGMIKSRVVIPSTEFNNSIAKLPEVYLASASSPNVTKMWLPVISADKNLKKPVTLPASGFWVCDVKGEALKYSIAEFPDAAVADLLKSFLTGDKLILNTVLHTNCNNVTPKDLKIKLGNVEITKTAFTPKPTEPLKFNMDSWILQSSDWALGTNGVTIKKATVTGQLNFSVEDLSLTMKSVQADNSRVDFGSVKILGTLPVNVNAQNKGLIYTLLGTKHIWKLYAINPDNTPAASIAGLEGLNGQELPVKMIEMFSDGSPLEFTAYDKLLKIHGLVDFMPLGGTSMGIYDKAVPPYFMVQGEYRPGLPYIEKFGGNLAWIKTSDNKFTFDINNPSKINFTHNNMQFVWDQSTIDLKPDLFTAKGTATEQGKLGPVDIVLMHKNTASEIDIPADAIIYITQDKTKYFKKLVGGMEVNKNLHQWNNFWFEGVMAGMTGISNNPQESRLKFVCEGDIKASGQSVNVSKLDAFPGMELTYDIATSSLHGSLNIKKDLMGMAASGVANCTFDPHGWYLNITGDLDIPGIGGCGLFGLFGDYNAVPASIATNFGSLKCIPAEFQGKVSGFLLQGRMTKQLIPEIKWGVTLPKIDLFVGAQLRADLTLHARTWMSFDPNVNTYGIALLAEGNICGGVSGGIYSLYTSANAQLGISGTYYSNGSYNVTGCGSVKAGVTASVWLPEPVGWTGVSITSPDIGLKMKISDSGTDFGLILESCGDNLCPEPPM